MSLDFERCFAATQSRDPRFDGRFFVAVRSTRIYCRSVCPVPMPKAKNVRFYPSAAAAAAAGYRPCLRCRPEAAPGTPEWLGPSALVARGLQLIEQGALDQGGIEQLSSQLNVGPRQLRRLFVEHLGAPPLRIAQTRRLHFAKKLIDETDMPMTQVAFAAGYSSVRRFNHAIRRTYARTPTQLRNRQRTAAAASAGTLELTLSYRPPLDWEAILRYLKPRAIPGVERIESGVYRRTVHIGAQSGVKAASTLAGQLASRFGERLETAQDPELAIVFPAPASLARADLGSIGMPRKRAEAVREFARAVQHDSSLLHTPANLAQAIDRLTAIPGIGSWTAHFIALRGLGEPDAFPAGDLGLRSAAANGSGRLTATRLAELSQPWRPFRAYAAMHLWSAASTPQHPTKPQ